MRFFLVFLVLFVSLFCFCGSAFALDGEPEVTTSDSITIYTDSVILDAGDPDPLALDAPIDGGVYFHCQTSQLGEVWIYIPVDYQRGSWSYYNGNLFNLRSSLISGFIFRSSGSSYSFRCSSFSTPEYRLSSGYSYEDLTVTSVLDTNIQIADSNSDFPLYPDMDMVILCILLVLGVICICKFMMR